MSTCIQHKQDTLEDERKKIVDEFLVRAFVELSYSDQRRKEMQRSGEKDCSTLVSILETKLEKEGAENINVLIPLEKKRFADIIFELEVKNVQLLEQIKLQIAELGGKNISEIKTFIVKE